jgi:predicted nucleic acid-binding protein
MDADVLINLMRINKLDILPRLVGCEFYVPQDVWGEVHRKTQRDRLKKAINKEWLREIVVDDFAEMGLYAEFKTRFGKGESACLAVARNRGWVVVSDDKAVKRFVEATPSVAWSIVGTEGILRWGVEGGVLQESEFETLAKRLRE